MIYKADGCTDPDAVLKWVADHACLPPDLLIDFFGGPHAERLLGRVHVCQLFCGARLFDSDPTPEIMIAHSDLTKRIADVFKVMLLPVYGFKDLVASVASKGAAEVHKTKVFYLSLIHI